jgi:hypothetical protein
VRKFEITFLFILISFVGFILESTVLSFPITFLLGAIMLFYFKKVYIYAIVILNGFIIDSLRIENFLYTPFFLLTTVGLIFLYEKFSGSSDRVVSTVIVFSATLLYANVMYYSIPLTIGFYFISALGLIAFNLFRQKNFSI